MNWVYCVDEWPQIKDQFCYSSTWAEISLFYLISVFFENKIAAEVISLIHMIHQSTSVSTSIRNRKFCPKTVVNTAVAWGPFPFFGSPGHSTGGNGFDEQLMSVFSWDVKPIWIGKAESLIGILTMRAV